jgi:hypothetical protein
MRITSHIDKFRRFDAVKRRLDPEADTELWIWSAMNACTNLLNAALHHCGLTEEVDSFHTQIEGLYAVPDRDDGTLTDSQHPPGDIMHVDQPAIPLPWPPAIERACAALITIEDLRKPYVRGNEPIKREAITRCELSYFECVEQLSGVLEALTKGKE